MKPASKEELTAFVRRLGGNVILMTLACLEEQEHLDSLLALKNYQGFKAGMLKSELLLQTIMSAQDCLLERFGTFPEFITDREAFLFTTCMGSFEKHKIQVFTQLEKILQAIIVHKGNQILGGKS